MPDEDAPAWARVVRAALTTRGLSGNAAARLLGVSAAALSSWLTGRSEPGAEQLEGLARLAGVPHAYLMELAGRIPSSLGGAWPLAVESRARDALRELQSWTETTLAAFDQPPAVQLVGAALERCPFLSATVFPRVRGRRHRTRAQTFVGFEVVSPLPAGTEVSVESITEMLGPAVDRAAAVWRERHQLDDWPEAPELVLMVLDQERSRPPQVDRLQRFGTGVCVLGPPYAHAELVGSVVAQELGYGFVNPLDLAQRRFGLRRDNDPDRVGMGMILEEILEGRLNTVHHVWACAEPLLLRRLDPTDVGDEFVLVMPGERLLAHGAAFWGIPPNEAAATFDLLQQWSTDQRARVVSIDDTSVFRRGELDRDALFDIAWEAGLELARTLAAAWSAAPASDNPRSPRRA